MNYYRLSDGLTKYKLIPASEDVYSHIKSNNSDYYKSLYIYNDEHYKQWKATGTVAGIKDTVTNKLLFDFDNGHNLSAAKDDAVTLVTRLIQSGIKEDNIQISFSGQKGFCIEVETNNTFTPEEFKNVTFALAKDLPSFDKVVNDAQRIVRVVGTKHPKTGLFKIPLSANQLAELPVDEIKKIAASDEVDADVMNGWHAVDLPDGIIKLKETIKEKPKTKVEHDLDMSLKPKWLSEVRYALQEGYFPTGEGKRNHAFLILAATYKKQGFNKELVYRMLKGVAEVQAQRNNSDRYPDKELWHNVVDVVFSGAWKGGIYKDAEDPLLLETAEKLNLKITKESESSLVSAESVSDTFKRFAQNIDRNTVKLDIPSIDENITVTTSMLVGLLAAPSAGKCLAKGTMVRMFDGSLKPVEELQVGEQLMGDDSLPRTILSTCRGREEMFEVEQANGDNYIVNKSHILSLKSSADFTDISKNKRFSTEKIKDVDIEEYLNWPAQMKKYYRGYKVGVEYKEQELQLDPYIMGLWLGDGTSSKPEITTADKEVSDYLIKHFTSRGLVYKVYAGITYSFTAGIKKSKDNFFRNALQGYEVIDNKHIPKQFLINSRDNRLKLLAGIIDSDGYKTRNSYEVTFKNEKLMDGLVDLCRSLGFRATKKVKIAKYDCITKGKHYKGESLVYRCYIAGDNLFEIPCKLPRKQMKKATLRTNTLTYAISLKSLGEGDYYGFEIDGNKRFLLKDYTVTHNTSLSLNILNGNSKRGINSIFFSLDMGAPLVFQRLIQKHTGMHSKKIFEMYKNDDPYTKEFEAIIAKEYSNTRFCFKSGITTEDIRNYIITENDKLDNDHKIKLVVIDYLECITGPYSDSTANTALISQQLKDIANELELTVILLLQPQKQAGDPSDELLSYRKIKGSSAIEQAASIIFTMWRPGFSAQRPEEDKYMTIAAVKNRMGQLATFDFSWEGLRGEIQEIDDYERQELEELRKRRALEKVKQDEL